MDITLDDIKTRLPEQVLIQLTDDERLGAVNQTRIDEAIAAAFSEAWPYVGVKYSVPITPTPEALKPHIISCAIKYLYARRVEEMPDVRQKDYERAIRFFKDIAEGIASLGLDPAPASPVQGAAETNKPESDRIFTRDKMTGY